MAVPSLSSVIIDQFNIKRIGPFETQYDSPIRAHSNRPEPFQFALERMQAVAGEVKFLRRRRFVEDGQYFLNSIGQIGPYSATVVALVKPLQAAMFEAPNHECKVYIVTCQRRVGRGQNYKFSLAFPGSAGFSSGFQG